MRHPHALAHLNEELAAGDSDAYLDAVINETLRVRRVIDAVWRKLTAPAEIAGYTLPAGVTVMPSIALVQRSDAYPDPAGFDPQRFLDGPPAPYTLIPFGGGPRRYIGASFAVMEMKEILRSVLSHVEVRAADPRPERVRVHHITLVPARGARVVVTRRRSSPASATTPSSGSAAVHSAVAATGACPRPGLARRARYECEVGERSVCEVGGQRGDGGGDARRLASTRGDHLERLPTGLGGIEQLRAESGEVGP